MLDALAAMWPWEALAVAFSLAYLVLAIRQNAWCWPAAIIGAAIYVALMATAGLYMQSVLQLFYIGMAVYGWRNWRRGGDGGELRVVSWRAGDHLRPLALILLAGGLVGWGLANWTQATWPFTDAMLACGAIVTTWMVARKVLQNWHYWFVIDAVSAWLYAQQGLWLTCGLFLVYLVLVVLGYRDWKASWQAGD
ncbi:nicotinamide mononucleotide transporter [Marinihelvus fidelis]|uniref:Nicotinamide riboside transporter PnuC n=1 Tax=Marinihelvus fidelis TaxID=2613842 RepID=A0A5N0T6J5_9GAMM|nr:nicotinamide riboside transporter PnuC [Marinihelvus fidelis]KAA9130421.1 nicotinamide mononucleotide transporter [Marinihelvus fidelis]